MKKLLLLLLTLVALNTYAQDVIVKKDGSTILSKVLEVNKSDIKYKKFSNQNGPTYTIDKSEVMAINFENGDKDLFNNETKQVKEYTQSSSSVGYIKKEPDARNSEIISYYKRTYKPTKKVKVKNKPANRALAIFGVKNKSILSNDEIEIELVKTISEYPWCYFFGVITTNPGMTNKSIRSGFYIRIKNKTDRVIYVDKGNCFYINSNGESYCYFDNSSTTSVSKGSNTGVSLGLGAVSNVLGVNGVLGTLANGMSIGGGNSGSVTTTYTQERVIAIAPHATKNLTENSYIKIKKGTLLSSASYKILELVEDLGDIDLKKDINSGQIKLFEEDEIKWKKEYFITYSTEASFKTYSTLNFEVYIHELIGGAGDTFDAHKNELYIEGMDEKTLNSCVHLY